MIKKYITIVTMCMITVFISAQTKYSLEDCKQLTIENNRKIKNTGNRKGAQVVQLYVKNPRAKIPNK